MTTKSWITRRQRIMDFLELAHDNRGKTGVGSGVRTTDEIQTFLQRVWGTRVSIDTIQHDVRELEHVGKIVCYRHPTQGHTMGQGSWVPRNGWGLAV